MARVLGSFVLLSLLAAPALAQDVWTDPYPGIRHLHRSTASPKNSIHVVLVDLTRPEVQLRATRSADRGHTVSWFASNYGCAVAVNGDFFDFSGYPTVGLAVGGGEPWPGSADGMMEGFVAAGVDRHVEISLPPDVVAPAPWMSEVVGGYPLLVDDGMVAGSAVCSTSFCGRNPRTAAGLSPDGHTFILVVVDGRSSASVGMSLAELAALMIEMGAARAINLDGGGSSAMFIQGEGGVQNVPSDGSERKVANHLGIVLIPPPDAGVADAPPPPDAAWRGDAGPAGPAENGEISGGCGVAGVATRGGGGAWLLTLILVAVASRRRLAVFLLLLGAGSAFAVEQDEDFADMRPEARAALAAQRNGLETARRALGPLPATIRVWRRHVDGSTSSCSGRVDVVGFEDYVKGVVPHEWLTSWDPKALEMGAVCVRTFAWWWVAHGGKYPCADLDDTTASQVYTDDRNTKTDLAADKTAGVAVVKDGALVLAEYSAENGDPTKDGVAEPYCTGQTVNGHGRGACQWGTQRWATREGRDFVWMAAHYYPGAHAEIPAAALAASLVSAPPAMTMHPGEHREVAVELHNDGAVTWGSEVVLGTTQPSPFFTAGDWVDPSRATPADMACAPGEVGHFSLVLTAPPVSAPMTFVQHFQLVTGSEWFGPAVEWNVLVEPVVSAAADAGVADEGAGGVSGGCSTVPGRHHGGVALLLGVLGALGLRRRR